MNLSNTVTRLEGKTVVSHVTFYNRAQNVTPLIWITTEVPTIYNLFSMPHSAMTLLL